MTVAIAIERDSMAQIGIYDDGSPNFFSFCVFG